MSAPFHSSVSHIPTVNGARVFNHAVARSCRPRPPVSVSDWAQQNRILSRRASSEWGPWRNERTPYLTEIQDCLSERSPVQRIVIMKSTQIGATEVGLNWLGYIVDHNPAPTLVVVPTIEVRKRWVKQRFDPMCEDTEAVGGKLSTLRQRTSTNTEQIKIFPGGMLVFGGANSAASLASMPIQNVICDELDRFPWVVGDEGDPLGLIEERQKTFERRKLLLISSPTIDGASRIQEEYEDSDQRHYVLPCPHCHDGLVLRWSNLKWSRDLGNAWYVCEHCGSEIHEHEKTRMLAGGRWVPTYPERTTRGYHINALYSPLGLGYTWLELARMFCKIKDNLVKLKRFINTVLGEPWKDKRGSINTAVVTERAEPYRLREAPPGCLLLTAGVDVQDNRLAVLIAGWGRREACWILDWLEIFGNPARLELWDRLVEHLNRPLVNAWGREMHIEATGIDTGGHFTHETYAFVRSGRLRRALATKGASVPGKPVLAARPTLQDVTYRGRTDRNGVQLWTLGSDTAKHLLYNRLLSDTDHPADERLVHFSADLPEDFYRQLLAERFDPEKNKFVLPSGVRNEALDCWVNACAAAHHPEIRIQAKRDRDWDRLAAVVESEPPAPSAAPAPTKTGGERARSRTGLGREDWQL